ncbi:MAG TPA: phosphate ABC transporter permease subunit PstC [Tepidisphaeraceae bacterium]|nr:phosphate ABC transporter permease subunit PstC [Tepidisphaeraceae bacterium]
MSQAGIQPSVLPGGSPLTPFDQSASDAQRKPRISGDALLHSAAFIGALTVFIMLGALLLVLFYASMPAIRTFGFHFLTSSEWRPNELEQPKRGPDGQIVIEDGETVMETIPPAFGALPVIYGTAVSSALSLFFAVPLSLGAAIFLVRVAPKFMKGPVSFLIEFLAAIPSIAYGIWGLFVLAPFLQSHIEPAIQHLLKPIPYTQWIFQDTITVGDRVIQRPISLTGRDMFSGSLVLAIMIVPIITAISRDVLRQVPRAQVEGSVALGATWWQSSKEMLKYSRSGLFGAVMLGLPARRARRWRSLW